MGTHDTVNRRIVVGRSLEEGLSDALFVDLVESPLEGQFTEVHQKAAEPRRSYKRGRGDDALHQLPSRIIFSHLVSVELERLIAHCGWVEALTQVHTRAMNAL